MCIVPSALGQGRCMSGVSVSSYILCSIISSAIKSLVQIGSRTVIRVDSSHFPTSRSDFNKAYSSSASWLFTCTSQVYLRDLCATSPPARLLSVQRVSHLDFRVLTSRQHCNGRLRFPVVKAGGDERAQKITPWLQPASGGQRVW